MIIVHVYVTSFTYVVSTAEWIVYVNCACLPIINVHDVDDRQCRCMYTQIGELNDISNDIMRYCWLETSCTISYSGNRFQCVTAGYVCCLNKYRGQPDLHACNKLNFSHTIKTHPFSRVFISPFYLSLFSSFPFSLFFSFNKNLYWGCYIEELGITC